MRNLSINKKPMYRLNYLGKVEVVGKDGYKTGEFRVSYSEEKLFKANVSGAKGNAIVETIGINLDYDKVITMSVALFMDLQIDENTVFFIDKKPEYGSNGAPLYDYSVKRICEALNEVVIAVKKVRGN